jgi:thiosulfate dehydrogenase [quinone] large subunit
MKISEKPMAYALLRIAFGVNFLGHGAIRVYHGIGAFAAMTAEHMAKTPLPPTLVLGFACVIPVVEVLLGIALILGILTRAALICGALFMMALTVGVTANQQWNIAGQQVVYSLVFFVLLFLIEYNELSLDRRMRRG